VLVLRVKMCVKRTRELLLPINFVHVKMKMDPL
jgi:hypothetical protein